HAEYRSQRSAQHRAFKCDWNERRPRMEGLAANIDRVIDNGNPVLKRIPADHPQQSANQADKRHAVMVRSYRLGGFFNREWRIRVHFPIARFKRGLGSMHKVGGVFEFSHQSVDRFGRHIYSFTFDCGNSVRSSEIEIAGINLINRKNSNTKKPMVPTRVMMSHLVHQYIPHELGRKSRFRLSTTITKRSSHIPVCTIVDTRNNIQGVERTLLNQSDCGAMMLQKISTK